MRAQVSIQSGQLKKGEIGAYTVMCDEGVAIGGTGTAPSPLQYFFLSIGFCMLTQVQRNAEVMGVELESVTATVTGRLGRNGSIEDGTARNGVTSVEIEVNVESPADASVVKELVRRSEDMCYVTQAVRQPVEASLQTTLNGEILL